jgi:hypothetical protein
MSYDAEGAIRVLQEGLGPERPHLFKQADALVSNPPFVLWPEEVLNNITAGLRTCMDAPRSTVLCRCCEDVH